MGEAYGESVFPVVLPCGPDAVREDFFRESAFVIITVGNGLRVFRAVLASLCPADLYGCQSLQAVVGIDSLLSVRVSGSFSFSPYAPFVGHGLSVVSGDGCNPAGAVPSDAGRAEAVFYSGESVQGVVLHFHGGPVGVADARCLSCHGVGGNCLVPVPVFFPDGAPEGIVAEMFFHAERVCDAQYPAEGIPFIDCGMVFSAAVSFPADGGEVVQRVVGIFCGVPHGVCHGGGFPAHGVGITGGVAIGVGGSGHVAHGVVGIGFFLVFAASDFRDASEAVIGIGEGVATAVLSGLYPSTGIVSVGDGGAAGVGGPDMPAAGCILVGGGVAVRVGNGFNLSQAVVGVAGGAAVYVCLFGQFPCAVVPEGHGIAVRVGDGGQVPEGIIGIFLYCLPFLNASSMEKSLLKRHLYHFCT